MYFSGSTEKCKTYYLVRKSLLKQGKNNLKYSYENPVPLDEVCPIFRWEWMDYLDRRRQMENATSDCVCNQSIMNRLLSDEYYQETFTKQAGRVRYVCAQ